MTISPERRDAILKDRDTNYNPDLCLLGGPMYGAGYHTTLEAGTPVHLPRESASYALQLLAAGEIDRANDILGAVCQLQDRNPDNKTCGIWSWSYEEPLAQMSPPDWNWADFIGSSLATALGAYADRLRPDVLAETRLALQFAAEAIQRRNVGPGYTNIAILGGGTCVMAGEVLGRPDLLEYGRERLKGCVRHRIEQGSFNEYNSPTYTMVVIDETERFLACIQDPETLEAARDLNSHAWEVIASHYHPPTRQWAGPHARAYSDTLSPDTLARLSLRVGTSLFETEEELSRNFPLLITPALPCPDEFRQSFLDAPDPDTEVRLQVSSGPDKHSPEPRIATTWFDRDACLGSISHDIMWTQRHGVIAYTRTSSGDTAVFRLRFMHDGHDFSSGYLETQQDGPNVSARIRVVDGHGDFHPSLDRAEDNIFKGGGWDIRLELTAPGASIESDPISLTAAPYAIQVEHAKGRMAGAELEWSTEAEAGRVAYVGRPIGISSNDLAFDALTDTEISIQFKLTRV